MAHVFEGKPAMAEEEYRTVLKKLVFAARTSGGVAGRDEILCSACDEAEHLLKELTS